MPDVARQRATDGPHDAVEREEVDHHAPGQLERHEQILVRVPDLGRPGLRVPQSSAEDVGRKADRGRHVETGKREVIDLEHIGSVTLRDNQVSK